MIREEVFTKIQDIFRDIFDDESLIITEQTIANDIDEWDSLNHINIVSAVEKEFHIRFALGELQKLKNIEDMISLTIEKIH